LTEDPKGYLEGLNRYEYILSKPDKLLDPFGLSSDCDACDILHVKNCWVTKIDLQHNAMKAANTWFSNISSQSISLAVLQGVASVAGAISSIAGTASGIIASSFPTMNKTTVIRIRGYKVEHFFLMKAKCGSGCRWNFQKAKVKWVDEEVYGDWYESPLIPSSKPFIKAAVAHLLREHRRQLVAFYEPSKYCRLDAFDCKKGEKVERPNEEEQMCEAFQWKTRD
jgi:hypothetical protein